MWHYPGMRALHDFRGRMALASRALVLLPLCACAAPAAPQPAPPPRARSASAPAGHTAAVHSGISARDEACAPGPEKTCNAVDDDCNGVIDDGCGYSGGGAQVTIAWDSGADIDLYVTDPSGATLYYHEQHRTSPAGGQLDHDARGDCRPEQTHQRIENAYWPAPPASGTYKVELHYFGPCGVSSQTRVTISVAALGKPVGTYEYALSPDERVEALSFVIP